MGVNDCSFVYTLHAYHYNQQPSHLLRSATRIGYFESIWNNFMLPYIMLGNDKLFPVTVGLNGLLNQGAQQPAMYTTVVTGALLSIVPLVALFLALQRYWQVDLAAGAVKA